MLFFLNTFRYVRFKLRLQYKNKTSHLGCSIFLAETKSCPRYIIIKICKNLVPAIFGIFLIMYSRIRHALRFGVSLRPGHVKIKTALVGRFKILIFWRSVNTVRFSTYIFHILQGIYRDFYTNRLILLNSDINLQKTVGKS